MGKRTVLRGHHLLCVHGFVGRGYSPDFAENMRACVVALRGDPDAVVILVDEPDLICTPCPHLLDGRCQSDGLEGEELRAEQDRRVLDSLRLEPGAHLSWREVVERIRATVTPADLAYLCADCQWLPLGLCAGAIYRLQE